MALNQLNDFDYISEKSHGFSCTNDQKFYLRKQNGLIAIRKAKKEWISLLISFIIYLLIAFVINALIDSAAYQTCQYYSLKADEILYSGASEWLLFFSLKIFPLFPLH